MGHQGLAEILVDGLERNVGHELLLDGVVGADGGDGRLVEEVVNILAYVEAVVLLVAVVIERFHLAHVVLLGAGVFRSRKAELAGAHQFLYHGFHGSGVLTGLGVEFGQEGVLGF